MYICMYVYLTLFIRILIVACSLNAGICSAR